MTERSGEYKIFSKTAEETVWPAAGEEGDFWGKSIMVSTTDVKRTRNLCSCPCQQIPEQSAPAPMRPLSPKASGGHSTLTCHPASSFEGLPRFQGKIYYVRNWKLFLVIVCFQSGPPYQAHMRWNHWDHKLKCYLWVREVHDLRSLTEHKNSVKPSAWK